MKKGIAAEEVSMNDRRLATTLSLCRREREGKGDDSASKPGANEVQKMNNILTNPLTTGFILWSFLFDTDLAYILSLILPKLERERRTVCACVFASWIVWYLITYLE